MSMKMHDNMASEDFERAIWKAFWRKITSWLTKERNTLLPFDEIKKSMPIKGQHYIGLRQVQIDKIVGSLGRYHDFDRAFLPIQSHTRDRWVSVDRARYDQVNLPPVELYKMGEIYFVKDGNHRVSVAREWGQEFIDAYVTEIVVPVPLTSEMDVDELELQKEYAAFLEQTQLSSFDPGIKIVIRLPGQYAILLEHISFHRWLLGEQRQHEVSYPEAAISWYENVYSPLVAEIEAQELMDSFPKLTVTDLYLWIVKYLWFLRIAYREEGNVSAVSEDTAEEVAVDQLKHEAPRPIMSKLAKILHNADWIEKLIYQMELHDFLEKTRLAEQRSGAKFETSVIGQYEILDEHISVHRWYLGEQRKADVPYMEAAASWYDTVYLPLVQLIREQSVLDQFPGRTETDMYLWIVEERADIYDKFLSQSGLPG